MFEQYTEKARRVIFFARYEASEFGAQAIGPEHILLGILREDKGLTHRLFPQPEQALSSIRKEIEARVGVGEKVSTSVDLPLSQPAKHALGYAQEESERASHRHIGTEHLVLGLLREGRSTAFEILYQRGLRLERVRAELGRGPRRDPFETPRDAGAVQPNAGNPISGLVGEYTQKAAMCFPLSWQWSARGESLKVEPEHLLLALMEFDQWLVLHFLPRGKSAFDEIVFELTRSSSEPVASNARPLADATLRVLARADEEAKRSGHESVDTEHLLLGILDEEDDTASRLLQRHGMDPDRIRREAFGPADDEA
jgi:ATP-dependent Clp protease ATP-binding subunit ClpA